jgi:two-component system sensor histidine kinase AtoS
VKKKKMKNVEISILDNGPGISEDSIARIQDSFFTTKENHMGIGLTLVRRYVGMMNGDLQIVSRDKYGGAGFHVILPVKTRAL